MILEHFSPQVTAMGFTRYACLLSLFVCGFGPATGIALSAETVKKYLIIHADDAGMSHSVNKATIEVLEKGTVSSASILVPCPWFPDFAAYAKAHPQYCYGVHLALNSEWKTYRWGPVAPREKVPSLVDPDGFLWQGVDLVARHAKTEEVVIELRAQIDRARQFGVPLSHIDTHMGALVSRPDLVQAYVKLGIEYDLPMLFLRNLDDGAARHYPALAAESRGLLQRLGDRRFPVLDQLAQYYGGESHEQRRQQYLNCLRTLKPGVTQLIVHCGVDNEELRSITSSSWRRDGDRQLFTSPEMRAEIETLGIELIDWRRFRALANQR